jgi:hypothetical protein
MPNRGNFNLPKSDAGDVALNVNVGGERVYRLADGVLFDWFLFRRLGARGEARGAAGAADLRRALELVRGAPLAGAGRAYASWSNPANGAESGTPRRPPLLWPAARRSSPGCGGRGYWSIAWDCAPPGHTSGSRRRS